MAILITPQNYSVDNIPLGLVEKQPAYIRHINELANDINIGGSFSSFLTQAIAANNTAINANLGVAGHSNGVTLAGDALSVTVSAAGTYSFDAAMQFFKNNTTHEGTMTAWYAVNGAAFVNAVDGSANSESLAVTNQLVVLNVHAHLTLNAGDSVRLMFAGNTAGTPNQLQCSASVAANPYPAIASISLEVDKIR